MTRELVWATDAGKHVRVRSRRIVSLEHRHLVAMTYEVTMLDESAPVVISSLVFNRQDAQSADLPERRPADPRLATVLPRPVLNLRAAELAGQRRVTPTQPRHPRRDQAPAGVTAYESYGISPCSGKTAARVAMMAWSIWSAGSYPNSKRA